MKNKKIMAVLGAVLAVLVLSVLLFPFFKQGYLGQTQMVCVAQNDIAQGEMITAEMIKTEEFPTAYLPQDSVMPTQEAIVGQYAAADIFTGDFISNNKVVAQSNRVFYEPENLVAVTMNNLSSAVAAKLKTGDRVNVYGYSSDSDFNGIVIQTQILQNMEVAYVVSSNAQDVGEGTAAASVVLKVANAQQAQELIKLEYTTKIHLERISNQMVLAEQRAQEATPPADSGTLPNTENNLPPADAPAGEILPETAGENMPLE